MNDTMAQPGLGLTAPTSRQDVISALLNDYGNSFQSPNPMSPPYEPSQKELPPPPPTSSNEKPLPPVGHMSMRFPLRVDDPPSPASSNGERSSVEQPRRIASRSLSRSSKPSSLKLVASNGSTASLPPTPPLPTETVPSSMPPDSRSAEEKSLPPPPPEKSSLRHQHQPLSMGSLVSKELRGRKDSIQSQESVPDDSSATRRKAVPGPAKFKSLAELGKGPRGGKGGPLPPAPRLPRKAIGDQMRPMSNVSSPEAQPESATQQGRSSSKQSITSSNGGGTLQEVLRPMPPGSQMPPTPEDNPLPPPPKKTFVPIGLPSNPRGSKGLDTTSSVKHSRGKSSTGFDIMKDPPQQATPAPNTITPGPTPSPQKIERNAQAQSPLSPLTPPQQRDGNRPFSFEAAAAAPTPPPKPTPQASPPQPESPISLPAAIEVLPQFPPRVTSRPAAAAAAATSPNTPAPQDPFQDPVPTQQQTQVQPLAPVSFQQFVRAQTPTHSPQPLAPMQAPTQAPQPITASALAPTSRPSTSSSTSSSTYMSNAATPPFFPNPSLDPAPLQAPPITQKHRSCYSHHRQTVRSANSNVPMPCMICHANRTASEMRACTWCYLRICNACSLELMRTPDRSLDLLLERRGGVGATDGEGRKSLGPDVVITLAPEENGEGERVDFT